ncbi:hypothetical protein ABZT49_17455 [Methylobacterium sp. EM32]|uniref:hypothetical protein n=1 Tax=Methylobacterium sp. EM32 TaxID=3163481 RepID=UPI0033A6BA00
MAHFLILLVSNAISVVLYEIMQVALVGTLDPAIVPLAAGLAAWSTMVFVSLLRPVERRFTSDQRLGWLIGSHFSLIYAVMQGAPLWRLPDGYSTSVVTAVLCLPVIALSQITICAVFTREERDGWSLRACRRAAATSGAPTA